MRSKEVILITGGTGKLGSILVNHLANENFFVVFTGRNTETVKALENKLIQTGKTVKGIIVDHSLSHSSQSLIDILDKEKIYPHILINNVRSLESLQKINEYGLPEKAGWELEFHLAVIVSCELAMKLSTHGQSALKNIINITSIYGVTPPNSNLYATEQMSVPIHYGVAKAAQIHLTKELAIRLAKKHIRVNAVSFGGVGGRVDEDFLSRYAQLCPQGRMLDDDDVVGPVNFLLSNKSSGMTGHNLIVDGGWTVW